jgi:hypothetical protein
MMRKPIWSLVATMKKLVCTDRLARSEDFN